MNKIYNNTYNKSSNFSKYSDLEQCLIVGLPLYLKNYYNKKPIIKWKDQPGITSIEQFHALKKNYVSFATIPARASFLVLDIDIKHGINGINEIKKYYNQNNVSIQELNEAPYTITPGGGFHLWFRFCGTDVVNNKILPNVEVKYTTLVTAPGSADVRGKYILHGNLSEAPELPTIFKKLLVYKNTTISEQCHHQNTGDIDIDKMITILNRQGYHFVAGQRNYFIYQLGLFAFRRGKSFSEIINFCKQYQSRDFDMNEITNTLKSAYKI